MLILRLVSVVSSLLLIHKVDGLFMKNSGSFARNCENSHETCQRKFPDNFKFGAATAAYQIEGAWNLDGKGPNIWDTLCHERPELIADQSNADIGPDSYHLYKYDVKALKETGFHFYRFSISWSRLLPDGDLSSINKAGINYYNNLIDELIANDITPVATMLHYDLPQYLQNLGGFTNPLISKYFEIFANVLFENFGDRVKYWITFNEPFDFCVDGYGSGKFAPLVHAPGVGEYLCAHNVLKSHAKAFHHYKKNFYEHQKGYIGITLNSRFYFPKSNNSDPNIVDRAIQYRLGWFAHPIFSQEGGYPSLMVEEIAENSLKEGRTMSRLPHMDDTLKSFIKGSADFFGYNYYTSRIVEMDQTDYDTRTSPNWAKDSRAILSIDPKWKRAKSNWLFSVPEGFRGILNWIKDEYKNPSVLVTENGWSDDGQLNDEGRVEYYKVHLNALLAAILEDGCNVTGYTAWSIIDNFEWLSGYTEKFGLYQVNMTDPKKPRVPKLSAKFFKSVIEAMNIP